MPDLATSILLPSAKVAVFTRDEKTLSAAQKLNDDWRFARVHCDPINGDVQTATEAYAESASPDLMIIQTDSVAEDFTDALAVLAGYCSEGTAAIVVGPENDVNLYRRLIDMGISDYLVKPLTTEDLSDVIAKVLIEKLGVSGSRLIACMGAKGGVGTSVMAQALSWGVADILKQKTLLIDLAGGWSTASVGIGFESVTTISETVGAAENNDEDSINRVIHKASEYLHVLANGAEIMMESSISGGELEHIIDFAMTRYPAVIMDLSHASPALMYTVLNRANHAFLFSTPNIASLRFSRALLQEIKNMRGDDDHCIDFIINHASAPTKADVSIKDIEDAMGVKPASIITHMPDMIAACETSEKNILDFKEGRQLLTTQILPLLSGTIKGDIPLESDDLKKSEGFIESLFSKSRKD